MKFSLILRYSEISEEAISIFLSQTGNLFHLALSVLRISLHFRRTWAVPHKHSAVLSEIPSPSYEETENTLQATVKQG